MMVWNQKPITHQSIHKALRPAATPNRPSTHDLSEFIERPDDGVVPAAGVPLGLAFGADVEASEFDGDLVGVELRLVVSSESSLEDLVAIVMPKRSVVGGGSVVISAAATVISVISTAPLAVSTHKHVGVSVTVQSSRFVPYPDALSYVTRYIAALSVFVAAKLASGVGTSLALHFV